MASRMPWTEMTNLREQMDRLFDRLIDFKGEDFPAFGEWAPSLDLSETNEKLIVKLEIPGMDPKDVEVSSSMVAATSSTTTKGSGVTRFTEVTWGSCTSLPSIPRPGGWSGSP